MSISRTGRLVGVTALLILSVVVTGVGFAGSAAAVPDEGSGTSDDPYVIDDWNDLKYQTDILIYEQQEEHWKPRIIIEGKLSKITTHDAITYSQKAETHKNVHPYLRYGILIGKRKHFPLPGRLFRHGQNFDFMISWVDYEPNKQEWQNFIDLIGLEYRASLDTEEFLLNSRKPERKHYTIMHKHLKLR